MSLPSRTCFSLPSPPHPSRWSQSTRLEHPAPCHEFPLVISFTYGNMYVSILVEMPKLRFDCGGIHSKMAIKNKYFCSQSNALGQARPPQPPEPLPHILPTTMLPHSLIVEILANVGDWQFGPPVFL